MLAKVIKFVRQHLAAVVGIAAIVLTLLLMLLPGQFADLKIATEVSCRKLNGYQFLFNFKRVDGEVLHPGFYYGSPKLPDETKALPAAIAIIVLFVVTIASLVFYKKSSALFLLGGITEVVSSIFFFAMEANVNKFYQSLTETFHQKVTFTPVILWVSYFAGALLLLAGAYVIYKAILVMKDEVKHPQAQAGGPTYNYLKK